MTKTLTLLTFLLMPMVPVVGQAATFLTPNAVELSRPYQSPYPNLPSVPVDILPQDSETIVAGTETFYYANGIFYQKLMLQQKYIIVPPPIGAVVFNIPDGYQLMMAGNQYVYVSNGIYYKRVPEGFRVMFPPALTY